MSGHEVSVKERLRIAISDFCLWRTDNAMCDPYECEFCPVNMTYDMTRPDTLFAKREAERCLVDNGIDPDEVHKVLQALGYILLDEELYPEDQL